jgi:hypothetical protein
VERFRAAAAGGDLQGLLDVLSPDVVLVTDGGGVRKAALRPIHGREKVLRFLAAVAPAGVPTVDVVALNGGPGVRFAVDGEIDTMGSLTVGGGRVTGLYLVRNPEKLTRAEQPTALAR